MQEMLKKIVHLYRRIFSLHEIETNVVAQWMMGVSLLFFYASFNDWMAENTTTVETAAAGGARCWPYFQECTKLYFLHGLPAGYTQMIFYMGLFCFIGGAAYFMWRGKWIHAHACMLPLFAWKVFAMFVLSYSINANYDYYHVTLTFILLFLPYKEYFMKACFVLLYFLSVTTKFHQTWILGTYFTSLKTGFPIFPSALAPLTTNSVIFMQVVGCWFLMSKNLLRQRLALIYFAIFHLYSGIFVGYHYPTIALTALLALFGPLYRYTPPPFRLRELVPGFAFLAFMCLLQLPGHAIWGDQKLTLEGNKFGMYMFEANHQCVAHFSIYTPNNGKVVKETSTHLPPRAQCGSRGQCEVSTHTYTKGSFTVREVTWESAVAWNRCDPYDYWSFAKSLCKNADHVSMQFDHSINGGPFYRIVDQQDICGLTYSPFTHNSWIKLPVDAPIMGYPVQNILR